MPEQLSVLMWKGRRRLVLWSATGAVAAGLYLWVFGINYTSRASFVVQARRGSSGLSGLATQFGIAIPADQAGQSPQFYADLLVSDAVLSRLGECPIDASGAKEPQTLQKYLVSGKMDETRRRALASRILRRRFIAVPSVRSGTVSVRFHDRRPSVALSVVKCSLSLLDEYNQQIRRTSAANERRFAELRVSVAQDSLRSAESGLEAFLTANRSNYNSSPRLRFDYERMEREIVARQQVVTALRQMLEQARLEEVRDTPAISVVELPLLPALPDPGQKSRTILLAIIIAAFCAAMSLVLQDGWPTVRSRIASISDK